MLKNIISNLKKDLPGTKAWARMAVRNSNDDIEKRQKYNEWLSDKKKDTLKKASVLIALFNQKNELAFPLIKRPLHEKNHPGQIALPGGSQEQNETLENTAKREAYEEMGINPDKTKIIGKLTPLPVPVSGYLIHPYIGILDKEPKWKICEEEVDEFFIVKVSELIRANNGYYETWDMNNKKLDIPIFKVNNQTIWGATASVLSEFIELTK
ncbi:MAG: NUDIX hydrolase [Candidatus Poseidoniales archaeon]